MNNKIWQVGWRGKLTGSFLGLEKKRTWTMKPIPARNFGIDIVSKSLLVDGNNLIKKDKAIQKLAVN